MKKKANFVIRWKPIILFASIALLDNLSCTSTLEKDRRQYGSYHVERASGKLRSIVFLEDDAQGNGFFYYLYKRDTTIIKYSSDNSITTATFSSYKGKSSFMIKDSLNNLVVEGAYANAQKTESKVIYKTTNHGDVEEVIIYYKPPKCGKWKYYKDGKLNKEVQY